MKLLPFVQSLLLFLCMFCLLRPVHAATGDASLIGQYLYLENHLIKDPSKPLYSEDNESITRYVVSVAASFVLSKALDYVLWQRISTPWIKHGIAFLTPGASGYQDACQKINTVVFGLLLPLCLYIFSELFDYKLSGDTAVLASFIRKWPVHKRHTPERFHAMFNALYQYYVHQRKLVMSETTAHLIVSELAKIIVDFITEANKKNEGDIERYERQLVERALSTEAAAEIKNELMQLKSMSADAQETLVLKKHIEWILALPWGIYSEDVSDLMHAQDVLDQHHYGMQNVKEKILDYLAVRALSPQSKAPILCLAGPPGVGKTSIGNAIAQCVGRKFFRIALGGMSDEVEIRGHRRSYVGSLPGRIIQAIRTVGVCNPVLLLDEIDKISGATKGDPTAALLEVLDSAQNAHFYDNYLGIPFDLSSVLFIATANNVATIPKPLQDRMEIIMIPGYTNEEKMAIAKQHIIPKAIKDAGLEDKGFAVDDAVLAYIIETYANQPGMRELERCVHTLCARFARHWLETGQPLRFDQKTVAGLLA